jgi:hypothetical protein
MTRNSHQPQRSCHRRLLQQNRHKCDLTHVRPIVLLGAKHRRHFSFHVELITQRYAQVLRPLCVAFNEEIVRDGDLFPSRKDIALFVRDGDLFPSRKDIALACEAASVGDLASRLGLQLAISTLPCFRASAPRPFFDQHAIISFERE